MGAISAETIREISNPFKNSFRDIAGILLLDLLYRKKTLMNDIRDKCPQIYKGGISIVLVSYQEKFKAR
jgi:hypothetical protein